MFSLCEFLTMTSCSKFSPNIPLHHCYIWLTFLINSALHLDVHIFSASALISLYISARRLHLFPAVTSLSCTSFLCFTRLHHFKFFLTLLLLTHPPVFSYERTVLCSGVDCFAGEGVFRPLGLGQAATRQRQALNWRNPSKTPDCATSTWLF